MTLLKLTVTVFCWLLSCLCVWSFSFYARKRLSHRCSVCLSVRLSHRWISQKWCKLGLPNLHCRLPGRL